MLRQPAVWPLFFVSAAGGGNQQYRPTCAIGGVHNARRSRGLRERYRSVAAALQLGVVVGPAVAGLLIGQVGVSTVFWVDVATFTVSFGTIATLGPMSPEGGGTRFGFSSMVDGIRYLKGRQVLQGTFVADLDAMVFGMPRALFPAIGLDRLHGGAATVGLLYAAPGAGALIGAILTGWVRNVLAPRHGGARVRSDLGSSDHGFRVHSVACGVPPSSCHRRRR